MKKVLKTYFVNLLSFVFAWQYLPAIVLSGTFEQLLLVTALYTLLDKILKPLLKVITLPLKFLTFGLIDIAIVGLIFYVTTEFIDGILVQDFIFEGISTSYLIIPPLNISYPYTYVVCGLIVVLFNRFFSWVFRAKVVEGEK